MANEQKALSYKRSSLKRSLTRLKTYFDTVKDEPNIDSTILDQLNSRLSASDTLLDEFYQLQEQIDLLAIEEEIPSEKQDDYVESILARSSIEKEKFEHDFYEITSQVKSFLKTYAESNSNNHNSDNLASSSTSAHQCSSGVSSVRFPQINLPNFSGNYQEWMEFHDLFQSLIHNDSGLQDIQKFHYLKSCLKGEAANVIKSLEVSSQNYQMAWTLLNDRFENKRLITNNHLRGILDLEKLIKESPSTLRNLSDEINKHLRCLKTLGHPVESWDILLIQILVSKLDPMTRREWEQFEIKDTYPSMVEFTGFIKKRCEFLEAIQPSISNSQIFRESKNISKQRDTNRFQTCLSSEKPVLSCIFCKQTHSIYNCSAFLNLDIQKRILEMKNLKTCLNCLRKGHFIKECRAMNCRKCNKRHHTLLHLEQTSPDDNISIQQSNHSQSSTQETNCDVSCHSVSNKNSSQILLATIVLSVKDSVGDYHRCRALLDCGSQSNFVTEELCSRLNLQKENTALIVSGISESISDIKFKSNIEIQSLRNNFQTTLSCLVLKQITGNLPSFSFDPAQLNIPANLCLADPAFFKSEKIDLLLGASVFWEILCAGQIQLGDGKPILQKTLFGWILSGNCFFNVPMKTLCSINHSISCHSSKQLSFEETISKFWELEDIGGSPLRSAEEDLVEKHYLRHVNRDPNGRFVVSIPFRENVTKLGESRDIALKRLYSTEQKLSKHPTLKHEYDSFLQEYLELGHMSPIDDTNIPSTSCYLPHHCVQKESSTTTKVRVVFDASSKTSTGLSLNDVQMVGPVVQCELFSIILNFRLHKYVITADCEKMYRQVLLSKPDRDYHRILWRCTPDSDVSCFVLNTVTYGTASASYLATRVLKHLADEYKHQYPVSCKVICDNFYMDDLLTGADSVEELAAIKSEVTYILKQGGFNLRKWSSNEMSLLCNEELTVDHYFSREANQSTLGIIWNPNDDMLRYKIREFSNPSSVTKRMILSISSQIFDPLGLLSPIIIVVKLLIQRLWQLKITWDESIPLNLQTLWLKFRDSLPFINSFEIRRLVLTSKHQIELHGFADASEKAYGACIFLRSIDSHGHFKVALLCSKSKVAPIKSTTTLPRLELCASLLLANLSNKIKGCLDVKIEKCFYYSDSTIALSWIKSEPSKWKTFVGNRVASVQRLTKPCDWFHVSSSDNPADLITRGISPEELKSNTLWWEGPSWLHNPSHCWPINNENPFDTDDTECKPQQVFTSTELCFDMFNKFSSFRKLTRVTAYIYRFIFNLRSKKHEQTLKTDSLSVDEIKHATNVLLSLAQHQTFPREIEALSSNKTLDKNSKLLNLNPFLDQNKLIRVGGRLSHSTFCNNKAHPIVLSNHHPISKLLACDEHLKLLHCGPQQLLYSLREKYWLLSGRSLCRKIVHNCVICFKAKPRIAQQLMGELPSGRLEGSYPFENTGVDYAGPFLIRDRNTRNYKTSKAYIALFICFLSKAIHIELVSDLTSECFIAALRRFVARRGKPKTIHSDNGTNFVGAKNKLNEIAQFLKASNIRSSIMDYTADQGIEWVFIPPRAPHFGGLWEAGVKSIKIHLKRVIGTTPLTFESFSTVLTQVEAVLNSRPLSPLSSDPQDPNPLTPSHFLIGRAIASTLDQPLQQISENRLNNYQKLQRLIQSFWTRWRKEYISELQVRNKWKIREPNLKEGDLVILKEDNLPPCHWVLGRIQEIHLGKDKLSRVVTVKCSSGVIKRPISKICPLPRQ